MSVSKRAARAIGIGVCVIAWDAAGSRTGLAQEPLGAVAIAARSSAQIRDWDARLDRMLRGGDLRQRETHEDSLMPGRMHQRADQYYKGVRVFGGDVARQLQNGLTRSVFGMIYESIDVDPSPTFDEDGAGALLDARLGAATPLRAPPELMVLPLDAGGYALAWRLRAVTIQGPRQFFIDAHTGSPLLDYNDRKSQTAIGRARGVLGDTKKISVQAAGGRFESADGLRPPSIETYDMQGNPARVDSFLFGRVNLSPADLGSDADNDWTDAPIDDAHVYAGWTYDYYFKRFGRHGLNNADVRVQSLVHPVHRADASTYIDEYRDYFVNAFYDGDGIVVYGEGLPAGMTIGGQTWDYLAGSLDVVAHELTHGVTEYTSNLIYRNESGALNEAFSDMMGTSAEFFFQPPGSGPLHADYLLGEDVIRPGGLRSMADPAAFGDPDHYSKRYTGTADNGGVHVNSGIPNHVFYLAIEGGTNRTSGVTVQGVGAARREEIEKVFYRAFTQMMPSNATFGVARGATIQAAQDLYGAGSAAERAVAAAWTAVGVE